MMKVQERLDSGIHGQAEYEVLVDEIATIRLNKVREYGPDLQLIDNWPEASLMTWANIGRKFRRLRRLLYVIPFELRQTGKADRIQDTLSGPDRYALREALLDLANYCLYGVQMLDKLLPAPKVAKRSPFFIEQIALVAPDPERMIKALSGIGLGEWSRDRVTAIGTVFGDEEHENTADLAFNYQLGNFELELINYRDGENWLVQQGVRSGLSHFGFHVKDIEGAKQHLLNLGYQIAQEVNTTSHTNPNIKDNRRYHYCIFDTRDSFGFDLKLIKRIEVHEESHQGHRLAQEG